VTGQRNAARRRESGIGHCHDCLRKGMIVFADEPRHSVGHRALVGRQRDYDQIFIEQFILHSQLASERLVISDKGTFALLGIGYGKLS